MEPVTHVCMVNAHLDSTTVATLRGLHEVVGIVMGSGKSLVEIAHNPREVERILISAGYKPVIEENREMALDVVTPHWNLDRLDEADYPLDGAYQPIGTGAGIRIYVLDTGVNGNHNDFGGRVEREFKLETPCTSDATARHHGSWVASIAAGDTLGVARRATINDVKLPNGASCTFTICDVLQAMIWLLGREPPFVVTMSFNTVNGHSECIDSLVADLRAHGAFLVAAAGNSNDQNGACGISPARSSSALTVAAIRTTDTDDVRSSFSNYGLCIWGFAPGSDINGASATSDSGTVNFDGTSASVPHVAGMAAQLMTRFSLTTPDEIDIALAERAVLNKVTNALGTPNRLVNLAAAGYLQPLTLLLLLVLS